MVCPSTLLRTALFCCTCSVFVLQVDVLLLKTTCSNYEVNDNTELLSLHLVINELFHYF